MCLHKCVSQRQREKQQSVWLPKITEKNRRRRRLLGFTYKTRRAFGGAHVPPTKVFRRLTASLNETIVKPRVAAAVGRIKPYLSRVSILTRDIDIANLSVCLSVRPSVRMAPISMSLSDL